MSAQRPILRVFTFGPLGTGSAIDESARATILPDLLLAPGIVDAFVGRRSEDGDHRVLVTVWESNANAADERSTLGQLHPEERPALAAADFVIAEVRIELRTEPTHAPRILRVFRGEVRPGELEAYLEEARVGTLEDAATNTGLIALYLGVIGGSSFVTASVWTDWESIELATGGNLEQPMTTKNSARLASTTVTHFEVLPNGARPTPRPLSGGAG